MLRKVLYSLILLMLLAGIALWLTWRQLPALGISELSWQGATLSTRQLRFTELTLRYTKPELAFDLNVQDLEIGWASPWSSARHLTHVRSQETHMVIHNMSDVAPDTSTPTSNPAQWIAWLPRQLQSGQLHVSWPCQKTLCRLQGALTLQQPAGQQAPNLNIDLQTDTPSPLVNNPRLQLQLKGSALLEWTDSWHLSQGHLEIQGQAAHIEQAGITLKTPSVNLSMTLEADAQQARLTLLKGSRLRAERLQLEQDTFLLGPNLQLDGLRLEAHYPTEQDMTFSANGPLALQLKGLEHPSLQPSSWTLAGTLQATPQQQRFKGQLDSGTGLAIKLEAQADRQGAIHLQARLNDLYFKAGNPLQHALRAWPALLSLSNGRLQASADWRRQPGKADDTRLQATLDTLDGIFDRTEIKGISAQAHLALTPTRMTLEVPRLSIAQANIGLPLTNLAASGRYQATLDAPTAGTLHWQQAQLTLLGGEARLKPGQLDLTATQTSLELQLHNLQLSELFKVYPADGLAGRGTLDGTLPLIVGASGVKVEQGQLRGRPEGGQLQFRSPRMQQLAQSNPGMKLVVEALDDFHYRQLGSSVSYDQQGRLLLGLRLEGQNPAVEQGRPINFTINLEEDLPALLTSLQLTGKVSDLVRQRVQQHLGRSRGSP